MDSAQMNGRVVRTALVAATIRIREVCKKRGYGAPVYECKFCGLEKSRSIVRHYIHLRSHGFRTLSAARYRCKECLFYFTAPTWLTLHKTGYRKRKRRPKASKPTGNVQIGSIETINGYSFSRKKKRTTECGECSNYDGPDLISHLASAHGLFSPFQCSACKFSSRYYSQFKIHRKSAHRTAEKSLSRRRNRTIKCGECNGYDGPDLISHLASTHGLFSPFQCSDCKFSSTYYSQYKVHRGSAHRSEGEHKCPVCASGFTKKHSLARHMWLHEEYKCPLCTTSLRRSDVFREHVLSHGCEEGNLPCGNCGEVFQTVSSFLEHVSDKHKLKRKKASRHGPVPKPKPVVEAEEVEVTPEFGDHWGHFLFPDTTYDLEGPEGENSAPSDGLRIDEDEGGGEEATELIACQFCGEFYPDQNSYLIHTTQHRIPFIMLRKATDTENPIFI